MYIINLIIKNTKHKQTIYKGKQNKQVKKYLIILCSVAVRILIQNKINNEKIEIKNKKMKMK
jgi:hypothetical protein